MFTCAPADGRSGGRALPRTPRRVNDSALHNLVALGLLIHASNDVLNSASARTWCRDNIICGLIGARNEQSTATVLILSAHRVPFWRKNERVIESLPSGLHDHVCKAWLISTRAAREKLVACRPE